MGVPGLPFGELAGVGVPAIHQQRVGRPEVVELDLGGGKVFQASRPPDSAGHPIHRVLAASVHVDIISRGSKTAGTVGENHGHERQDQETYADRDHQFWQGHAPVGLGGARRPRHWN